MPEKVELDVYEYTILAENAMIATNLCNLFRDRVKHYRGFTHDELKLIYEALFGIEEEEDA